MCILPSHVIQLMASLCSHFPTACNTSSSCILDSSIYCLIIITICCLIVVSKMILPNWSIDHLSKLNPSRVFPVIRKDNPVQPVTHNWNFGTWFVISFSPVLLSNLLTDPDHGTFEIYSASNHAPHFHQCHPLAGSHHTCLGCLWLPPSWSPNS